MLEESSAMDKKGCSRSSQPPAKAAPEGKKFGETSSARYNRRRESTSSKNGISETVRKASNPFKQGKLGDKRPRPRGQYYGSGKQETKVEELGGDPEDGSSGTSGKRKQNLNHLLNFTLAPRPAVGSGSSSLKSREAGRTSWLATHKHKYNKEEFLQANCQFVVKSGIDYSPYLIDPDLLVDWALIEQIRLRCSEVLACPICLDVPVAAKMTRCGHVYCWSCILHYLALSDKTWRKCPICYESVHRKDLKSVVAVSDKLCRVGETFTLKLMKRERGSLLVVPVEENDNVRRTDVPLSVSESVMNTGFSKLLLAQPGDVKSVLWSERVELEAALKGAEGEPEVCFIEQALQLLTEREAGLTPADSPLEGLGAGAGDHQAHLADLNNDEHEIGNDHEVVTDPFRNENVERRKEESEDSDDNMPNVAPEDVETESQVAGQKPFYFYQAADGQNVFLAALNLRMLEAQYGGIAHAPLTITGPVLEKESGSMTRELRIRLRSISHLPITAAFELLELDLSSCLSRDILDVFSDALRQRADKRRRRDREERRRDRRITQQVQQQWGQRPGPRIRLDSARHFPRCGQDDPALDEILGTSPVSLSRSNSLSSIGSAACTEVTEQKTNPRTDEFPMLTPSPIDDYAGPSFAQMLKVGASTCGRGRPAWGRQGPTPAAAAAAAPSHRQIVGVEGEEEEYGASRYQHSLSDALSLALDRADFSLGGGEKGKKKKRKQKVLFSSGMAFASK